MKLEIKHTQEEFWQPLDTLKLGDYILDCWSKHASSLKKPVVFGMVSATQSCDSFATWDGE